MQSFSFFVSLSFLEFNGFLAEGALGLLPYGVVSQVLQVAFEARPVEDVVLVTFELYQAILRLKSNDTKCAIMLFTDKVVSSYLVLRPLQFLDPAHFLKQRISLRPPLLHSVSLFKVHHDCAEYEERRDDLTQPDH